jgi:hypothetical protein
VARSWWLDSLRRTHVVAEGEEHEREGELEMVRTVRNEPRGALNHLWTWVQAAALVYVIVFGLVLLGAAVTLTARGAIDLVFWIAGVMS